jgi:hypothetical protein
MSDMNNMNNIDWIKDPDTPVNHPGFCTVLKPSCLLSCECYCDAVGGLSTCPELCAAYYP